MPRPCSRRPWSTCPPSSTARRGSSWCGSTAGRTASAARPAGAPQSPERLGRHPTGPPALPLHGPRHPLRRPHRHDAGQAPPAAAGLGAGPPPVGLSLSDRQTARELDQGRSDVQLTTGQPRTGPVAGPQRCGSGARSGSTRPASSLAATGTRPPLTKGAPGAPAAAEGPARGWYARQGQVAGPGPAPAQRRGRLAHAGGRPAHDDPAPHRGKRRRRRPGAYRRARRPRPAGGAGLRARDRVPRPRRVRATRTATAAARSASARWRASDRLLRSWSRPQRGTLRETPPAYPGFFRPFARPTAPREARLGTLLGGLLAPVHPHHPESQ